MNLISLEFSIFLIGGIVIYWSMPEKYRYLVIFVQNIIFLVSYNFISLIMLFIIASVTFILGKKYKKYKNGVFTVLGVIFVLLMMVLCRLNVKIYNDQIVFVVGLSFWGLQAISYLLDLYMGKTMPEYHFLDYCIYLSLFINLTSGPIERADSMIPKIRLGGGSWKLFVHGCEEMLYGLFLKLVVGERLALIVNYVYNHISDFAGVTMLAAVVAYSI